MPTDIYFSVNVKKNISKSSGVFFFTFTSFKLTKGYYNLALLIMSQKDYNLPESGFILYLVLEEKKSSYSSLGILTKYW